MSSKKAVIGIDLGTVDSCVGVFDDQKVKIITFENGKYMLPSYVAFTDSDVLVGHAAKDQIGSNPKNTIFGVKRLMGLQVGDPSLRAEIKRLPYTVVEENLKPKIQVQYKSAQRSFLPEEVSGLILMRLKKQAEEYLETKISDAVITVPAHFTDRQRQATKDAAAIAGLNVLRIINEPTAAAIAYCSNQSQQEHKKVLVFDLGGGTFSVSVLDLEQGALEVMATGGDTHFGGVDFERKMASYLTAKLKKRQKDVVLDPAASRRLLSACEFAKRQLTEVKETRIDLHSHSLNSNIDVEITLTREKFEKICAPLFAVIKDRVEQTLKDAKVDRLDITDIIFVGGASQIPKIQESVTEMFPKASVDRNLQPEKAVAIGATLQAAALTGCMRTCISDMLIIDVLPHSLGIEVTGGLMNRLIKRNSTIPTKKTAVFSTNVDNQTSVTIKVFEGEYVMTSDNHFLGRFDIVGISEAKKNEAAIAVTFIVDHSGILSVTAEDLSSNVTNQITVHYDKGSLDLDNVTQNQPDHSRMLLDDHNASRQSATTAIQAYESLIQKAMSDPSDTALVPLEIAMARRQCNLAIMWMDGSTEKTNDKSKLEHELRKLEESFRSILFK